VRTSHRGRSRDLKPRQARQMAEELCSVEQRRADIVTRYAILRPHSPRAVLCRSSTGRFKAGYRTEQAAQRVADLLFQLDPSQVFEPYRCRQLEGLRKMGEHWHLATKRS